jgi:adenylate cyclase
MQFSVSWPQNLVDFQRVTTYMKIKINFHTKLFIVLGAVVCLSTMSILFIIQETTKKRVQENIKDKFESTRVALRHLQKLREKFAINTINNLTKSNAQFRAILSTASVSGDDMGFSAADNEGGILKDAHLRLYSTLPFLSMYRETDIFIVTNAEGILLFSKASPEKFGDDLTTLRLFEELAEKGMAADVWYVHMQKENYFLLPTEEGDAVYQVIAKPIVFRGEIHGVVICGNRIDKNTLSRIKRISGVDVALYSTEGIHVSTLPAAQMQALTAFIKSSDYEINRDVHETLLENENFLSMPLSILAKAHAEEGGFIVLKSLTKELAFVSKLRITLLSVGGIILLIAIGFSFFLSKGITRPVKKLSLAAKEIGKGRLETKVDIRTGDELEHLGDAFNGMVTGLKERDFIKSTFERYVSANVAEEIIKNPDMLRLGGERRTLTIFFTDIGNFTDLSEMLEPEDLVRDLNTYFRGMTAAILEHNGTIDKFQGDCIMAFWGAPISQEDHALLACKAALKCKDFLRFLEEKWISFGYPPRTYRFGLNTGEVVVGNIGSSSRFEYTIIGDDVNLASRLEGANKYYGTQIIIAEKTYSLVKEELIAREIDIIRVVGKKKPVKIFELVAEKGKIDEEKTTLLEYFEAGLYAYRDRQWEEASSLFMQALSLEPEDKPAKLYIQRCKENKQMEPAPEWDWVCQLDAK